jgi:hypothetical protein
LHSQHEDRNGKGRDEGSDKGLDDENIKFFYHFVQNNRLVMENSKVTLSPQEWALVQDPEVILTKNSVIEKVYGLFGQVAESYVKITQELPGAQQGQWLQAAPKISRGEKYKELPWVMLDYPRYYTDDDTRAMRHFFGWGSGFGIHLILQGASRDRWCSRAEHWIQSARPGWMLDFSDDPWQHHPDTQRCRPLNSLQPHEVMQLPFIKYSCWQPLSDWNDLPGIWSEIFRVWISVAAG